jgi:HSP20 family protein
MAPRRGSARSYFYNDIDGICEGNWEPNTDIFETEQEVIIRLELASVSRDDISIIVKNGKLHITGMRQRWPIDDTVYFHQMEIHCGEFGKVITLPESLEHNEIVAALQDGILDIRISKQSNAVEIPVAVESQDKSKS